MSSPRDMKDYLPILADQGMKNITGADERGITMQRKSFALPAGGVIVFADHGMADMADGDYSVLTTNHTSASRGALVALVDRLTNKLTITGASTSDVIDLVIVGQAKGQVA